MLSASQPMGRTDDSAVCNLIMHPWPCFQAGEWYAQMLLMWTAIEASVPMPCFSMRPISSLSVR